MLKDARAGILLLVLLTCAIPTIRHYAFRLAPPHDPMVAETDRKDEIFKVLSWYAGHGLRALKPGRARLLVPEGAQGAVPGSGAVVYSWRLAAALGLFEPCAAGNSECRGPKLARELRSTVWWPGEPAPYGVFQASPYEYEILEVLETKHLARKYLQTLEVRFRWKITGLSEIERRLSAQIPELQSAGHPGPGAELEHKVEFIRTKYGYVLPLTREPREQK